MLPTACPKPTRAPKQPKPLRRKRPINRVNRTRKRERYERAYLDPAFVALVRWKGCVVPGCRVTPVQACHRVSRAAGGTWREVFGACYQHHAIQHSIGIEAFERRYGVGLEAECARNVTEWMIVTK